MNAQPTRRGILGAMAVVPALGLVAMPAAATSGAIVSHDPQWPKLVADFRTKYAAWFATIDLDEDASGAFHDACASLPAKPVEPGAPSKGRVLDKTVRELRDECDTPEHQAAWAVYKQDLAAWQIQHDTLRDQIVGPAKAAYERAFEIRSDALNTLMAYRVTNLGDLGEKIEIIRADYDGCDIPREYVADILADVRHLAAEGR